MLIWLDKPQKSSNFKKEILECSKRKGGVGASVGVRKNSKTKDKWEDGDYSTGAIIRTSNDSPSSLSSNVSFTSCTYVS